MTQNKRTKTSANSWKDYFYFSRRVRRGLMVLSTLILLEILLLFYLKYKPYPVTPIDPEKFKMEIDALYDSPVDSLRSDSHAFSSRIQGKSLPGPMAAKSFYFNPNQMPDSSWAALGFSTRQIRSIKNYESNGGRFRTKEDVKKMYAINDEMFRRIEPFILLPDSAPKRRTRIDKPPLQKQPMDIGTADSTELEKLPLIGPYLARRISVFRERLGGFCSINQLREVHGLSDSAFLVIRPKVMLKDSTNLRKINLNEAGYEELARHPYIASRMANLILAYRKQHGPFQSPADLQKVALVDEELYRKIAPYLKTE